MNVHELIAELQKHDGDLPVYVDGYEGGVNDLDSVSTVDVHRDVNDAWYYGKHETTSDRLSRDDEDGSATPGLRLT